MTRLRPSIVLLALSLLSALPLLPATESLAISELPQNESQLRSTLPVTTDGDPVDLSTGLYILDETDLFLPDVIPITFTRTYRPGDPASRPLYERAPRGQLLYDEGRRDVVTILILGVKKPLEIEVPVGEILLKGCQDVENPVVNPPSATNALPLLPAVLERLGYRWDALKGSYNVPADVDARIRSTVLVPPQHGTLILVDQKNHVYSYEATSGYLGKDQVTFLVDADGRRLKYVVMLAVVKHIDEHGSSACERMGLS